MALLSLLWCLDDFSCYSSFRQVLFGDNVKKPQSLSDADLSKLYTATSLMQIDDNVMRYERGLFLLLQVLLLHTSWYACRNLVKCSADTLRNPSLPLHWIKHHKNTSQSLFLTIRASVKSSRRHLFISNVWTCSLEYTRKKHVLPRGLEKNSAECGKQLRTAHKYS